MCCVYSGQYSCFEELLMTCNVWSTLFWWLPDQWLLLISGREIIIHSHESPGVTWLRHILLQDPLFSLSRLDHRIFQMFWKDQHYLFDILDNVVYLGLGLDKGWAFWPLHENTSKTFRTRSLAPFQMLHWHNIKLTVIKWPGNSASLEKLLDGGSCFLCSYVSSIPAPEKAICILMIPTSQSSCFGWWAINTSYSCCGCCSKLYRASGKAHIVPIKQYMWRAFKAS